MDRVLAHDWWAGIGGVASVLTLLATVLVAWGVSRSSKKSDATLHRILKSQGQIATSQRIGTILETLRRSRNATILAHNRSEGIDLAKGSRASEYRLLIENLYWSNPASPLLDARLVSNFLADLNDKQQREIIQAHLGSLGQRFSTPQAPSRWVEDVGRLAQVEISHQVLGPGVAEFVLDKASGGLAISDSNVRDLLTVGRTGGPHTISLTGALLRAAHRRGLSDEVRLNILAGCALAVMDCSPFTSHGRSEGISSICPVPDDRDYVDAGSTDNTYAELLHRGELGMLARLANSQERLGAGATVGVDLTSAWTVSALGSLSHRSWETMRTVQGLGALLAKLPASYLADLAPHVAADFDRGIERLLSVHDRSEHQDLAARAALIAAVSHVRK